jgi:hypothetical protein
MHLSRTYLFAALLLLAGAPLNAQTATYQVPATINFSTAEDCRRNKEEFIKATDYLLLAPIDAADRRKVNAIAMLWMTNSDEVSININADVLEEVATHPELMMVFMIGWARHVLQTGDVSDLSGNLAGTRAALKYYKDPAHKAPADKKLDRLAKLDAKGELEAEMSGLLKKAEKSSK